MDNSRGRHVWEGWHTQDFINDLEIIFPFAKPSLKTKEDVRKWCKSEQPYYKKHIPEVANHFIKKANL
jgi:hypothetical protein